MFDANVLMELEYEFCKECGKLVEASAIIFSDPNTKVIICRDHEDPVEEYKQKAIKKKPLKNKRNEPN